MRINYVFIDLDYRLKTLKSNVLNVAEHKENVNPNDTEKVMHILFSEVKAIEIDHSLQNMDVHENFYLPENYTSAEYEVREGIELVNDQLKGNVSS